MNPCKSHCSLIPPRVLLGCVFLLATAGAGAGQEESTPPQAPPKTSKPSEKPARVEGEPAAEEAPLLITDRADQTASAFAVPPRMLQLEFGWLHTQNDDDSVKVIDRAIPQTLLRYGINEELEFRFGFAGIIHRSTTVRGAHGSDETGLGDTDVGLKYVLAKEDGQRPQVAVIGTLILPTGEADFSRQTVDPSVRFAFSHSLAHDCTLSYNAGIALESQDLPGRDLHTGSLVFYTLAFGKSFTEKFGGFVEVFGDIGLSRRGGPSHSFDWGVTYLVQENVQFDALAGFGLSEDADDWFVGAGVSVLLPN
ncbi:MAG: transporter [Planctomycetes bacterium]|nr:transporter [Planctomycetota bacterium]